MLRTPYFAALGLVALWAAAASAQEALAPRTLTRVVDTVVIPGSALGPRLAGAHKDRVRVYSCRGGFMAPIVFQVDERSEAGGYCYDQGPEDRRVKDADDGLIDGNDELLVLARDAGDRARPEALRLVPGHTAVQEVELSDPLDGRKAWVYVFRFDRGQPPPRLPTDLVRLTSEPNGEGKTWYWRGERFFFHNGRSPENAVRATFASYAPAGSRDVSDQPNVLDCTIVKAVVNFMWVEVVRKSGDFKVELGGYIDGPVRVVAENRLQVYLALGIWVSAPDSYLMLWPNKVSMPTNASCPVNLDESGNSSYLLAMDLARTARGWQFYNEHNPEPVTVDGRISPGERTMNMSWPAWNCLFGPEGAIITKFVIPPELVRDTNRLVYIDDEFMRRGDDEAGLEFEQGAFGTNGYLIDMRGLKEGIYPGDYVVWYPAPPFRHGDHKAYLNEYDHPIRSRPTVAGQ